MASEFHYQPENEENCRIANLVKYELDPENNPEVDQDWLDEEIAQENEINNAVPYNEEDDLDYEPVE